MRPVTVGFDPFAANPPMFAFAMPLFLLMLLVLIAGVILGGVSAWMRQSHWRRRARRLAADLKVTRAEAEKLRRQLETAAAQPRPQGSIAAIAYRHPHAALTSQNAALITADEINRVLTYPALIEALREGFRADIESPLRHTHMIPQPSGSEAKYLLMPAWTNSGERVVGCKIVSVYPDNAKLNKPAVFGSYLLISGETGEPLAVLDGTVLTVWRTACASALAASYLAREDASHLVMVGAGALAPHLIHAHAAVRPIKTRDHLEPDARQRREARLRLSLERHRARDRRRSRSRGA